MRSIGSRQLLALGVAGLVVTCSGAMAQSGLSGRLVCHAVGGGALEPLGDRDGHAISAGQLTCRVEGGPQDGGVLTGTTIYEWDKGSGVLLSGSGITRKPGAMTAYQHSDGKISLTITDGKVTGSTFTGRGRITMATGAASSLQGKTYSYAGQTTGPGQFTVDVKYD